MPSKALKKPVDDLGKELAVIVNANFQSGDSNTKAPQNAPSGPAPKRIKRDEAITLPLEIQAYSYSEDEDEVDLDTQDDHAQFDLTAVQIDMETMKRTAYVYGISPRLTELDLETEFAPFGLEVYHLLTAYRPSDEHDFRCIRRRVSPVSICLFAIDLYDLVETLAFVL